MFKVTAYPHGTFSWADCNSTNPSEVKPFYTALMGWDVDDIPIGNDMVYTMFQKDGENVCGLSLMQPDMQAQGIPSHWMSYIAVDNVDALADKVTELGGIVLVAPFDVMESGRMLVLQDPTGAQVSLWEAKNHIGASLVNTFGAMIWNELLTHDVDTAKSFYGGLLGWEYQKMEDMDYHLVMVNGRMNGGIMNIGEGMEGIPPHWAVYFSVEDIDAAAKQVEELGGKLNMPIMNIGETGQMVNVTDPAGAFVVLMQPNQPDPWIVE